MWRSCKNIHAGPEGKQQGQTGGQGLEREGVSGHNQGAWESPQGVVSLPQNGDTGERKKKKEPILPLSALHK